MSFDVRENARAQLAVPEDLECERGPHAAVWKQAPRAEVV